LSVKKKSWRFASVKSNEKVTTLRVCKESPGGWVW
jgi:hypothetical protein